MRSLLRAVAPVLVLPPVFFIIMAYPRVEADIDRRLPLLTAYYLSRQLQKEISVAQSRDDGVPRNYQSILADYGTLVSNEQVLALSFLSGTIRRSSFSQRLLEKVVLWGKRLPGDYLQVDPVKEITETMNALRLSEQRLEKERERIIQRKRLDYLKYQPDESVSGVPLRRGLPLGIVAKELVFCGETVPLLRRDVSRRIEHEIEYLLTDFRENTGIWLKRKDRYGEVVKRILQEEGIPPEFTLLPALESSYSSVILSPLKARGWWQFTKATAVNSAAKDPSLDWTLRVDRWRDERCDLGLSTRSAARYLKWLRSRLRQSGFPVGWLTVAAAYNAGASEIGYRVSVYKTPVFWDIKLPKETEGYIPRWIALQIIDTHRDFYGLDIPAVAPLDFETLHDVQLEKDLPLTVLAALTDSSVRFLREINGALRQDQTAFRALNGRARPGYTIHVPRHCKELVHRKLEEMAYVKAP